MTTDFNSVNILDASVFQSGVINTGTSFPLNPVQGQSFYRTDVGAQGLYVYNSGSWVKDLNSNDNLGSFLQQNVTAGTYTQIKVGTNGLVTQGSNPTTLAGYGIVDAQPINADLTAISNLNSNGILVRLQSGSYVTREILTSGIGISVTNPDGIAGNPTIVLNANSVNNAESLVLRDSSGSFQASNIYANLVGNASSASNLSGGQAGSLVVQNGTTTTFVAPGAAGYVLTSTGTGVNWTVPAAISQVSVTTATDAASYYPVFTNSVSGANTLFLNQSISIVPSVGKITATAFSAAQGAPNNTDASSIGFSFSSDGDTGMFSPLLPLSDPMAAPSGTSGGGGNGIVSIYTNNIEHVRYSSWYNGQISPNVAYYTSSTFYSDVMLQKNVVINGLIFESINTYVAAGTTQATATALTSMISVITGTGGVILPSITSSSFYVPPKIGTTFTLINQSTGNISVYPQSGAEINSLGANVAFVMGPGIIEIIQISNTNYLTA